MANDLTRPAICGDFMQPKTATVGCRIQLPAQRAHHDALQERFRARVLRTRHCPHVRVGRPRTRRMSERQVNHFALDRQEGDGVCVKRDAVIGTNLKGLGYAR